MEYNCRISAFWDESTYDNIYTAPCSLIKEECFEDYDTAMAFLRKMSEDEKVNWIEVETANGASFKCVNFYRPEHPFTEIGYEFGDIDWFIENEKYRHIIRTEDPEPFDLEMQYIDLFAGLSSEMIAGGKSASELFDDIPDGKQQLKSLFRLLCRSYVQVPESFDLEKTFDRGLPYFLSGVTEASIHAEYWQQAWRGEYDELHSVYNRNYAQKNDIDNQPIADETSFTYFFFGVYFIGLVIYVA